MPLVIPLNTPKFHCILLDNKKYKKPELKIIPRFFAIWNFTKQPDGGAEGNRTLDLMNAIHALSQLSYGPT